MKNISLEVKLIEDIQSDALKRINDLQKALEEPHVLDPTLGKNLIEQYLWRTDRTDKKRRSKKSDFKNENDTIYGSIANKLARAIIEWKEEHKESPMSNLAIWTSYNSRLADTKWQEFNRVLAEDENHQNVSYVCNRLKIEELKSLRADKFIVERKRDLASIWFETLKDTFTVDGGKNYILPSIHYYLSKFNPCFADTAAPISYVAFFSEEPDKDDRKSFGNKNTRQENDILLRNLSDNDLYIRFPWNKEQKLDVHQVAEDVYNKLFKEVRFGDEEYPKDFPPPLTPQSAFEWSRRYAVFLRGLILCNDTHDLIELAETEPDNDFKIALLKAIEEEEYLRVNKEVDGQPYRCLTNIHIKVPSSEVNLGTVIIFSDKTINPALNQIISSSIWAVFSHLREVEESIIAKNTFKKHTSRSAVAAIMSRNMSHNVGSHVLWHLSRDIQNTGECPPKTQYFLQYLQQRMDFIAQITTSPISWCQSLNFRQLIKSFDEDQTILKSNIARSYSEDIKLSIDYSQIDKNIEVDLPGGMVGAQALYSIFENIIRNAAKHGNRENLNNNELRLTIKLEEPNRNSSSFAKFEWAKRYYKLTVSDNLRTEREIVSKLENSLSETMIDDEGGVRSGAWGMKEIKICASYLRRIDQHNIDLNYSKWKSGNEPLDPPIVDVDIEAEKKERTGALTYSFYLLQPKVAAIIDWQGFEKRRYKESEKETFRSFGIDVIDRDRFFNEFDKVVFRHDFIVLPIEFFRENIKQYHRQNELPLRIFLVKPKEIVADELENELSVLINDYELDHFLESPEELKFFLWRRWTKKFYGNYYLYIRWNTKFGVGRTRFDFGPDGKVKKEKNSFKKISRYDKHSFIEFTDENENTGIERSLVFDHKSWNPDSDLCKKAIFLESLDDMSPVRNLLGKISDKLLYVETLSDKEKMRIALSVFLIREAAATTIGILDNRIFRQGFVVRGKSGYGFGKFPMDFTLSETWEKRRVYFLDPKLAKENFRRFVKENLFPTTEKGDFAKYDFLILHQGDLDEIQSKMLREGENFEEAWEKLERKAKYLVIVTGRGMPQTAIKKRLRWVGYSALADELLGKSKLELVEMLYSLRATVNLEKL